MSKFRKVTKRILAGALAALMVLTAAPSDVFADEILVKNSIVESADEKQDFDLLEDEVLGEDLSEKSVEETEEAGMHEDENLEADVATEELLSEEASDSDEEINIEAPEVEAPNLTKMNLYDIEFRPVDSYIALIGADEEYPNTPDDLMDWDWDLYHGPKNPGPNPTAYDEDGITYAIGTLKFVSGYEAFSPDNPELWSGYFYPYFVGTEADHLYVKAVNGIRDDNDYQNPEWGDEVSSLFLYDGTKERYDIISFANAEEAKTKGLVLTAVNGEGDNAKVVATKTVSFERASFEEPTLDVMSVRYDADLYGKNSGDLHVGWMSFEDNEILLNDNDVDDCDNSGYLKYVDDYSHFSETGCNYFLPLYITEADAQENSFIAGSFESVKVFTNKGGEASAENLLEKSTPDGNVVVPIEDDATTLTIKAKTKSSDLRESKIIENTYDISKIQIESYEAKYEVGIEPCDGATNVFGKSVSELQGVVVFSPDSVNGILNYVDSYEAAFPGTDCKHFLAVTIPEAVGDEAANIYEYIKVLSDKGTFEEAGDLVNDPSHDGIAVISIAHDANELYVKVKPKRGEEFTQTYDLAGLKLLSYADQNEISVEAVNSGEKYGKSIEELQEDTVCAGYDFSGTLKYVDSFENAFPETDCKHFLAVNIAAAGGSPQNYDYIKVYTDKGSVDEAVNLVEEDPISPIAITEIADDATTLYVTVRPKEGNEFTQEYDISGLKLETCEETYGVEIVPCKNNVDVLGRHDDELQVNVDVGSDNNFYGTLKYVESFPGFEGRFGTTERKHFLAVTIPEAAADGASEIYDYIKVFANDDSFQNADDLIASASELHGLAVIAVSEGATELYVKAKPKCGEEITQKYGLSKLQLEKKPASETKVEILGYYDDAKINTLGYITDLDLLVNGVVQEFEENVYDGSLGMGRRVYTLNPGDKYKLVVKSQDPFIDDYPFNLINYSVGTRNSETGLFEYGKKVTIKNNAFTYNGTVREKDIRIDIVAYGENYAMTSKDMTVKQKTTSIYSNQDAVIANVKFAKNVTMTQDVKVEVDGTPYDKHFYDYECITGDLQMVFDDEFGFQHGYGKHKVTIIAPSADDSTYQPVSKTITVNVLRGISDIIINNGAQYLNIYKADGKAASASIKLDILAADGKPAASKKVSYSITDENGNDVSGVTVKNGKIKVDKNYSIKSNPFSDHSLGEDCLELTVTAADWEGNNANKTIQVFINNLKPDYAEVFALKYNDATHNFDRVKNNQIILDDLEDYSFLIRTSDVAIKDSYTVEEFEAMSNYLIYYPATMKASNSAVKIVKDEDDIYRINASKSVKNFTVTATDSSGSKVSVKSAKYSIVYSERDKLTLHYSQAINMNFGSYEEILNMQLKMFLPGTDIKYGGLIYLDGFPDGTPILPGYTETAQSGIDNQINTNFIEFLVDAEDKDGRTVAASDYSVSVKGGTKQNVKGQPDVFRVEFKNNKPITVTIKDKKTKESTKYTFVSQYSPKLVSAGNLTAGTVEEQTFSVRAKFPDDLSTADLKTISNYINVIPTTAKSFDAYAAATGMMSDGGGSSFDAVARVEGKEAVIDITLHDSNLKKGKYPFLLLFQLDEASGFGEAEAVLPVTFNVKSAPKVNFKPKKNEVVFNIGKKEHAVYDAGKTKNLDRVVFDSRDVRNVIINGKANSFTDYFEVDRNGNLKLTADAFWHRSLEEINANNRGYVGYRAYNGNSYVEGHVYVTINVSGVGFVISPLIYMFDEHDFKYGVRSSEYQSLDSNFDVSNDGTTMITGKLIRYNGTGWDQYAPWSDEEKSGLFIGLEVGGEDSISENNYKLSYAKVIKGAKEADIEWEEVSNDKIVIVRLDEEDDYEGLFFKISDENGKELDRYKANIDSLKLLVPEKHQ